MAISYYSDAQRILEAKAHWGIVAFTLFLAVALEFVPWPEWLFRYKPSFPSLAIVYWAIYRPRWVNYSAAILVGVLMDLANQSPLGFYGLSFCTLVFCANASRGRFALMGPVGQAVNVFVFLSFSVATLFAANLFDAGDISRFGRRLFIPAAIGACLWLALPLFVNRLRATLSGLAG